MLNTEFFKRVAIISDTQGTLYVEDVPINMLKTYYNNDMEKYIRDNYCDLGDFHFTVIKEAYYIGGEDGEPVPVHFEHISR